METCNRVITTHNGHLGARPPTGPDRSRECRPASSEFGQFADVFPTHHAPSFHDMFYLQAQFWHNQFYHFHFPHPRARNPGFRIAQLSSEKHRKFVPCPPCGILCSPSERFLSCARRRNGVMPLYVGDCDIRAASVKGRNSCSCNEVHG